MNLQRADEATVMMLALNYWNPTAVDPAWGK